MSSEDDHSSTDPVTTTNHATSVKLPSFAPNEALTWFRRAETQFRLKNISRTSTKADYVISALPESVFRRIAPWLDDQRDEIPYDELKTYLLKEYSPSNSERAHRLFGLMSQPLGDRTSKQVWGEISTLVRLPTKDGSGNYEEIDIKKELWLQTLPNHIRALLHDTDATPIADLIKKADALIESRRLSRNVHHEVSSVETTSDHDIEAMAVRPNHHIKTGHRRWARDNTVAPQRATPLLNQSGICRYHAKFGNTARNCSEGCKFQPKN